MRMPRGLLDQIRADLARRHPFAEERVGFLLVGQSHGKDGTLLLGQRYESIPDAEYVEDETVGARIGRDAIRRAMGHALAGKGVFHVHAHMHGGQPRFGSVDKENTRELIPSFCAVAPGLVHGALLLSDDHGVAQVWHQGGRVDGFPVERISVVGAPVLLWEGWS